MGEKKVNRNIVVFDNVDSAGKSMLEQLKAESERGTTIDIAKWKFETPKYYCTVFYAPGNHNFIKNMITCTSQADCAILVIDSTIGGFETGNFEDGQILQHALFFRTLGVKQIICCCDKMDATTPKCSKDKFDEIVQKLTYSLMMVGYNRDMVCFVPISGLEGDNLIERSTSLDWYKGPTLFEAIDHIQEPKKPSHKPLRLLVDNVYESDNGTVGVGCVATGTLKAGMRITFEPSGFAIKVKSLEVNGKTVPMALPGEIVSFPVENLPEKGLRRGHVASDSKRDPAREAVGFKAKVKIMDNYKGEIGIGHTAILDCHTSQDLVVFTEILAEIHPVSGVVLKNNPKFLKCGEAGLVKIVPTNPMVAEAFSEYPQLGCIVISDINQTVAFGVISSVEKQTAVAFGVTKFRAKKAGKLVAYVLGRALIIAACQLFNE